MRHSATCKLLLCLLFASNISFSQEKETHCLRFENSTETQDFFRFKKGEPIIVSAHRGGKEVGFPENCIESFQNVMKYMPAIFEIDPRLTKDSVIVLMHDATLDRTTDTKGKLADYTWEELQNVRLKDSEGNVTDMKIPLLEDVIVWSKGKTIINLDKKDVPMRHIVELIKKLRAESYIMLTVHTGAEARYYYDRLPGIMLSAFVRNHKEYNDMAISGVPWQNMIAYVGATIDNKNIDIVNKLRDNGVKCMISLAPTHDRLTDKATRTAAYKKEILLTPDIIESDIPAEVWEVLRQTGQTIMFQ